MLHIKFLKYLLCFKVDAEHCKSIFKIGSIEQLLLEIKKKMNLHLNHQNLRPEMSICNILEHDFYGQGLGCMVCVI